jgi:hypothetical protein
MYKTGFHVKGLKSQRGPAGLGFKLTPNGDYDMEQKSLENVKMPDKDDSAATKLYVDRLFRNDVDLNGHKILNLEQIGANAVNSEYAVKTFLKAADHGRNIPEPIEPADAVNKNYCDSNFVKIPEHGRNIPEPSDQADAVNKRYCDSKFLTKTEHGKNIEKPTEKSDAVNLDYALYRFLEKNKHGKNLPEPTADTDALTKGYAEINFLKRTDLDCRKERLRNVGKAEDDMDAVNMQDVYEILDSYSSDKRFITEENMPTKEFINERHDEQRTRINEMLKKQNEFETRLLSVEDIAERCSRTLGIVVEQRSKPL